jgi:O-antigen/teichoic acid export membrane protein
LAVPLQAVTLILIALGLSGTHGTRLSRAMQFKTLSIRSLIAVVTGGVVGVSMAVAGFQLWALLAQQLTINIVSVITLWWASGWWPRLRFSFARIVENLRGARHISFSALWTFLANDIDLFLAFTYFGPAAAGVYNVGKRIMISANMILVDAISSVSLAAFANIDETMQRRTAFLTGCRLTGLFTAPAFVGLAAIATDFVMVILGARWIEAAPILMALALSGYALSLGQFATSTLVVVNRPDLDSRCSALAAAVNVVAMFFTARYGPLALAATFSATTLCIMPIRLSLAMRQVGVGWRDCVKVIVPPLLAALLMGVAIWLMSLALAGQMPPIARLIIEIPLGALAYGVSMRVVAPASFAMLVGVARKLIGDRPHTPIEA